MTEEDIKKEAQGDINKKPFFESFNEKINDTSFLKNLRTSVILVMVVGVPLLYFGLFGNFDFAVLLNWKLGFLAVMTMGLVFMLRIDTMLRAFDDEMTHNTELMQIEADIKTETAKIKDHKKGRMFVKDYNRREQEYHDGLKTDAEIDRIKNILTKLEIAGKDSTKRYASLKNRLKSLETHPLHEKITPIDYEEIYTFESKRTKKKSSAKHKLTFSPTKISPVKSIFNSALKGFGGGVAGSLPFMFGSSLKTILAYYFSLFAAIAWTALQTYIKTRSKTAGRYKETRAFKLEILKECNQFIANFKEELPQQEKTEEIRRLEYEENRTQSAFS